MKRVVLCLGIIAVIVALSIFSLYSVKQYEDFFQEKIAELEEMTPQEDYDALAKKSAELYESWVQAEHVLIRFVRHTELDEVTGGIGRLEMLARFGDLSEFSAELYRIKTLLHHIADSETPYLRNIF